MQDNIKTKNCFKGMTMSNIYTKYIFESTDEILKEIKTLKEKVNNDFKKDSDLKDINDIANELYKIAIKISDSGTLTDSLKAKNIKNLSKDADAFMEALKLQSDELNPIITIAYSNVKKIIDLIPALEQEK